MIMSEPRHSFLTGALQGCASAITSVGAALGDIRAEQRDYLAAAFAQHHCEQLEDCLILPGSAARIKQHVQAVLAATTPPASSQAITVLQSAVQREQVVVARTLAPILRAATTSSGFPVVRALPQTAGVLVIGQDSRGRALQHQLTSIPGKPLQLLSQPIGMPNGTCQDALNRFQEELLCHGLTTRPSSPGCTVRAAMRARQHVRNHG